MLESYVQSNFSGGEWSPPFQGRIDDKEYQAALKLCLNYIPNQEGSLSPRSGFKACGLTKDGSPAKLFSFRFLNWQPYVAEHTANNLRFWANGFPILSEVLANFISVSGDPPVFIVQDSRTAGSGLVPEEWLDGDSIMIQMQTTADIVSAGYLANREWLITIVDRASGEITLTDAVTGDPLTGTVTMSGTAVFYKILDIFTPFDYVADVRQIQFTAQTFSVGQAVGNSAPEHRVCYLEIARSPRSLSFSHGLEVGLLHETFVDGPYLDSPSTTTPVLVDGTTGEITIKINGYSATIVYRDGDVTWTGANLASASYYVSIADNNVNNAPPTVPAATAFWASMPLLYSGATTYFLGQPAMSIPVSDAGVRTIYYSIQAANLNHTPSTNPAWWDTTPPTYSGAETYSDGAVVVSAGINYVSLVGANTGHTPASSPTFWLPVDLETALDKITNRDTGWPSFAQFSTSDVGDVGLTEPNLPRLIRLKASPQPWQNTAIYDVDVFVNYKENIYKSLVALNTGNIPDQDPASWEIQTRTILWTWARFTAVEDEYTATVEIMGDDLPDTNPVWEFRLGLYSDTTGWPSCGTYHEGRLWLSGSMPNRFDASKSNEGFNFAPTAPDGTVADNNAISYTLNTEARETIQSMASITEGVAMFTSEAEWLVSASSLNDPLTPTSIQAHRTTAFSAGPAEVTRLPSAIAVVQKGGRRLLEYRTFVDMSSYQSRLNTVDLTRKCQHLTAGGILQTAYQSLPQPIIWACPGGTVETVFQVTVCPNTLPGITQTESPAVGALFGMGYARTPDVSYTAPFSFEHGLKLARDEQQDIGSITVQQGNLATAEYLYTTRLDDEDGLYRVEMMMPPFESSPFDDTYNDDGTVATFGTLSGAYMLDSAITPAGCQIAANGLSATFYGLARLAGETVSFTCRGKYVGDYAISATGTVSVTFNDQFAKTDIGRAMQTTPNATLLPASFQSFYLDVNGNSGVLNPASSRTGFLGQFGYKYRRRGQMLRPMVVGRNGPGFAKTRRNHKMGIYVDKAQEISIGWSFSDMHPVTLTAENSVVAVTTSQFTTGIFREDVEDEQSYNGNLCWEQTDPVPGAVLAVGGFLDLEDV